MFGRLGITAAVVFAFVVTQPAFAAERCPDTLRKIRDLGQIVMGYREQSPPFSYIDEEEGNKPIGYSVDLCYKIIDKIKETLDKPRLKVKLVPVTPENRIPLLKNGTIDIECGSTTNTIPRAQHVDFLAVTFITGTKLVVIKGSGIREIEDLKGKTIAVVQGTTNEKAVKRLDKEQDLKLTYEIVKDIGEGFSVFEAGRVDAFSTDHVLLYGQMSKSKNPDKYDVVGRFLSFDPYSIMVPRSDSDFRLVANTVLADLMRSGDIQRIYDKWFNPGPGNINMPMSSTLKTAFEIQALPD